MKKKVRLHFQRIELKYSISPLLYQRIKAEIMPYMVLDPYSKREPSSTYTVHTLYLDTHNLEFYFDKIDGVRRKRKLRVRTYDPVFKRDRSHIFVEIKDRHHNVIVKSRAYLSCPAFDQFFDYETTEHLKGRHDRDEIKMLDTFIYWKVIKALKPAAAVRYQREAYFGDADERLRITFDRDLECRPVSEIDFATDESEWTAIGSRGLIMEIKFSGFIPYWLRRVIQRFNLGAEPLCKYALAIITLGNEDAALGSRIYY